MHDGPIPSTERWAQVDLEAVRANITAIAAFVEPARVMAVVKADGYGHGASQIAKAALSGGADWLGVAHVSEALALRAAGISAPILAWLHTDRTDFDTALLKSICLGVSSLNELRRVGAAALRVDQRATVHLKVDTGLGRNGAAPGSWRELFAHAVELERLGHVTVEGIFSHFSAAEDPSADHLTRAQLAVFAEAVNMASAAGLRPEMRHVANTAATLRFPDTHLSMVRIGIGTYGQSPLVPRMSAPVKLQPAMSLRTVLSAVKYLPANHGVSYGSRFVTHRTTRVGLVPIGYADGVPRCANGMSVTISGVYYPILGTIAMDQMVIDLTVPADSRATVPEEGDEVILMSTMGNNDAAAWARAADTINHLRDSHRHWLSCCPRVHPLQ